MSQGHLLWASGQGRTWVTVLSVRKFNPATRISRSGSLGRVPFAAAPDALPLSFLPGDVEPGPHATGITIPVRVLV